MKACDLLKKDPRVADKKPELIWQKEVDGVLTKDRFIEIDGVSVFVQKPSDLTGTLWAPYQNLVV